MPRIKKPSFLIDRLKGFGFFEQSVLGKAERNFRARRRIIWLRSIESCRGLGVAALICSMSCRLYVGKWQVRCPRYQEAPQNKGGPAAKSVTLCVVPDVVGPRITWPLRGVFRPLRTHQMTIGLARVGGFLIFSIACRVSNFLQFTMSVPYSQLFWPRSNGQLSV